MAEFGYRVTRPILTAWRKIYRQMAQKRPFTCEVRLAPGTLDLPNHANIRPWTTTLSQSPDDGHPAGQAKS